MADGLPTGVGLGMSKETGPVGKLDELAFDGDGPCGEVNISATVIFPQ